MELLDEFLMELNGPKTGVTQGILESLENYFMFLGWDLIPLFIFFVPVWYFFLNFLEYS